MNYLRWHYITSPKFILNIIGNYLYFVGHLFSIKLLLKTLFSPWKREIAKKEKPGLSLEDIVNVVSFNIISRILGFIIRFSALVTSFLFYILVLTLGSILFFVWLLIPVVSLPIFFLTRKESDENEKNKFISLHIEEALKPEDLAHLTSWYERAKIWEKRKKQFWTKENLASVPGIGRAWAYGYTPTLDKLTTDLAKSDLSLDRFIGREQDIQNLQRILAKDESHNALLVGEPGVGRRTVVTGFAKLVEKGACLPPLLYKRVLLLEIELLVSSLAGQTEKNLIEVLEEARSAGNIILVIPAIDEFVREAKDHINLTSVLAEHIGGKDIQIIGITDKYSYQKYILPNQTLLKLFEKLDILEVSIDMALIILEDKALELERKYKVTVSFESLTEIVKQGNDLISEVPFPEKAIDLLEETVVYVLQKQEKKLLAKHVDSVLEQKTKVPLGEIKAEEKQKLTNLEEILHKRVIGQDEAIKKVSEALRRKRAGLDVKSSPIGTFLFLGPTGVGKTETAKALALTYFGSEEKIIRLDMSQFQNDSDIEKLIGGNSQPGILTSAVRETPFTVLLLDEFEKGSLKILNIFLTVFDEGYITDGQGKKVSFKNTVIIATSNAASEFIREKINAQTLPEILEKELSEYLLKEKIFSPELVNRFDAVIFYKPLERVELEKIAGLMLDRLNLKLKKEQEITVVLSPQSLAKLVDLGFDPAFGARNLQRVIQEKVENEVAKKILNGEAQKGSQIEINL